MTLAKDMTATKKAKPKKKITKLEFYLALYSVLRIEIEALNSAEML